MNAGRAEELWQRALKALASRHRLPPDYRTLTPAELARATEDERLNTLVHGYYYPVRYGRRQGTVSEEAAEALVAAIEGRQARVAAAQPAAESDAPPLCGVCGQRPVDAGK